MKIMGFHVTDFAALALVLAFAAGVFAFDPEMLDLAVMMAKGSAPQ